MVTARDNQTSTPGPIDLKLSQSIRESVGDRLCIGFVYVFLIIFLLIVLYPMNLYRECLFQRSLRGDSWQSLVTARRFFTARLRGHLPESADYHGLYQLTLLHDGWDVDQCHVDRLSGVSPIAARFVRGQCLDVFDHIHADLLWGFDPDLSGGKAVGVDRYTLGLADSTSPRALSGDYCSDLFPQRHSR